MGHGWTGAGPRISGWPANVSEICGSRAPPSEGSEARGATKALERKRRRRWGPLVPSGLQWFRFRVCTECASPPPRLQPAEQQIRRVGIEHATEDVARVADERDERLVSAKEVLAEVGMTLAGRT